MPLTNEALLDLVHKFVNAIVARDKADRHDYQTRRKYSQQASDCATQLRGAGDAGARAFEVLLNDPRLSVRVEAAEYLLRRQPEKARMVLEEALLSGGYLGFHASGVLQRFDENKGKDEWYF